MIDPVAEPRATLETRDPIRNRGPSMTARYTLIVGTRDWSSWSLRPYLALRHIGVPFDEEGVALRRDTTSPEILKYAPSGRVPALGIQDGDASYVIWDSLAICET